MDETKTRGFDANGGSGLHLLPLLSVIALVFSSLAVFPSLSFTRVLCFPFVRLLFWLLLFPPFFFLPPPPLPLPLNPFLLLMKCEK